MERVYPRPPDIRTRRRNNAPIRPRRPATGVPDVLIAIAVTAWVMAAVFVAASYGDDAVTAGEAGKFLARLFSAALGVTGILLFLFALTLLRGDRGRGDHYRVPIGVGIAVGLLEAALFLRPSGPWLLAPFALLIFAVRPVRSLLARTFGTGPARR